jgi:WD40 repeat protein
LLACIDRGEIIIASTEGEVLTRFRAAGSPRSVTWSPLGDRLAVCSDSLEVSILARQGNPILEIPHPGTADQVSFSADGRFVAVIGQTHLQLCDASSGSRYYGHDLPVEKGGVSVVFTHDSRCFAWGDRTGQIYLHDRESNRTFKTMKCESNANTMAFSPDDALLATGHDDGVIRIWDISDGQLRSELVGHARNVREVAYAPDGRTLLSSSADGTVRMWSVEHNRSLGVFHREFESESVPYSHDVVCRLSISSDGKRLAVGYNNRNGRSKILLWEVN